MNWNEFFDNEGICVIIPTFNNSSTVANVISRVQNFTDNIIVVNDGSTDNTMQILENESFSNINIIQYEKNKGKGYALKCGMKHALKLGFSHAITIDSDGQHYPEDILVFIEQYVDNQDALISGERSFQNENMPGKNLFANKFSNFWFKLQTGINLSDTQCGFRMYPLKKMSMHWPITSRYESELEFLVFSAWRGIKIIPAKVNVYYPPENERISHFKPAYDFFRISVLNTILTILSVLYLPVRIIRNLKSA